ncbi:DsbA family protein [Phenylobacterium sp.]|uniref:DsbA family protein n=1 Tax=Phenylobacterium sp. TaxID=1871053 RepID=UPI0025E1D717|nr:DsbA family protein [Phenylobacterium sp.]MBX3483562.1 DsbA family protein [Phenylobacterium sp.]MCW5761375.1 DsbA family protein [Phenylobacterium sp.]
MKRLAPLAAIAAAALALSSCQKADDAAFGAKVRAYLLTHPEVLEEAIGKLQEKKQQAALTASKDAIAKLRRQIENDPRDVVVNPAGTITVTEFFDFNCGYCKLVAPEVVKLAQENPDVRLVLKQFAFQTPYSIQAGRIALTADAKGKALPLYASLLAQKPLDAAAIDRSLVSVGLDPAAARRAAESPEITRQMDDARELAAQLQIDGTPAFVVGDQVIHGADIQGVRAAIEAARAKDLKRPT